MKQNLYHLHRTSTSRFTCTVHPMSDTSGKQNRTSPSCLLTLSFAMVLGNVLSRIAVMVMGRKIIKRMLSHMNEFMDKLAFAAEIYEKEGLTKKAPDKDKSKLSGKDVIASEAEKCIRNIRDICSD